MPREAKTCLYAAQASIYEETLHNEAEREAEAAESSKEEDGQQGRKQQREQVN